ncbi:unnamed protein product [Urochloa humidicola]
MGHGTEGATARSTWLAIEAQFLGNKETCALQLDARLRTFVQGDLSITEYCKRFKKMANDLANLGEIVHDRTLVLNVLRGLNEKYVSIGRHLHRSRPFPTFLQAVEDLTIEEMILAEQAAAAPSTVLITGTTSSQRQPAPSQQRPSSSRSSFGGGKGGGSGGSSGNSGGSGDRNSRGGRGKRGKGATKGGATSQPPAGGGSSTQQRSPAQGQPAQQPTQWPSYYNPWTGTIHMWPGPRPPVPQPPTPAPQAPAPNQ